MNGYDRTNIAGFASVAEFARIQPIRGAGSELLRVQLPAGQRRSFTLVEMLVVLAVIALLAATVLSGMQGVQETARVARTKGQITRLNELVMIRWESYRSRPVPFDSSSLLPAQRGNSRAIALARLTALRELMRMELPDRVSDVRDFPNSITIPVAPTSISFTLEQPALWRAYRQRARAATGSPAANPTLNWSPEFQGAECLYMIVASSRDGGTSGLDHFKPAEIGDVDGDGMPEFLDGWGNPIEFIRWAPDYLTDPPLAPGPPRPVITIQTRDASVAPDPFDPMRVDPRWPRGYGGGNSLPDDPYALYPLIFSAGQDESYDVLREFSTPLRYSDTSFSPVGIFCDPYVVDSGGVRLGLPADADDLTGAPGGDGVLRFDDNIMNHALDARLQAN